MDAADYVFCNCDYHDLMKITAPVYIRKAEIREDGFSVHFGIKWRENLIPRAEFYFFIIQSHQHGIQTSIQMTYIEFIEETWMYLKVPLLASQT